ncbi:hypothetical protein M501DRAFT_1016088 [Patellaria atrata CBS 101060]|uniref:RING-type E3 ubiquitin transferase n=1 Tax=Patellaria atrata CBS 101060 TaxID=1346257 RepID=A0A9P4SAJ9_9PEZI|nr:hypothetical protein M501DRAFT_1016088 [Patellaria atrata CBS 101060]
MRPLRLLLTLTISSIAVLLLCYANLPHEERQVSSSQSSSEQQSRLRALFSFTSPSALFPPSAIISLTDDNSTFFLARPAAFGPLLPSKGLSGQVWIGSGFGDITLGRGGVVAVAEGELGCSDVPGWSEELSKDTDATEISVGSRRKTFKGNGSPKGHEKKENPHSRRGAAVEDELLESSQANKVSTIQEDDGTDNFLHQPLPDSGSPIPVNRRPSTSHEASGAHADIQSLQESAEIEGKIVLLSRGGCGFLEKVKWAQRRGGVAIIVGDNVRGGPLITMYAKGDTSNITIPALFTSHTTAHLLSSLIPSGGVLDTSSEDPTRLSSANGNKVNYDDTGPSDGDEGVEGVDRLAHTQTVASAKHTSITRPPGKRPASRPSQSNLNSDSGLGWFTWLVSKLGFSSGSRSRNGDSRRPPSSGNINWVEAEDWEEESSLKPAHKSKKAHNSPKNHKQTPTKGPSDNFVIGEQDWRDPDLLPVRTATNQPRATNELGGQENTEDQLKGGSVLPGSGEYAEAEMVPSAVEDENHGNPADEVESPKGWLGNLLKDTEEEAVIDPADISEDLGDSKAGSQPEGDQDRSQESNPDREGLWVTLTPTNMSTSPFFDTLLVLVVSPLVTLTVVYALLLVRSRIRRRRWRAPKSVVDRLPVRTYHTLSNEQAAPSTPYVFSPSPNSSSPTTPLLQPTPRTPRPPHNHSRPRSRTTPEVPRPTSPLSSSSRESSASGQEKREAGLAEWRRRYGGRQKECVVCLEEYVDGVSKVMSLPCGHEFHAECITPWLITRRRTCPICKGDVVRSLARNNSGSSSGSSRSPHRLYDSASRVDEDEEDVQTQAITIQNNSASAHLLVPDTADLERGEEQLSNNRGERGRESRRRGRGRWPRNDRWPLLPAWSSLPANGTFGLTLWGLGRRTRQERDAIDRTR